MKSGISLQHTLSSLHQIRLLTTHTQTKSPVEVVDPTGIPPKKDIKKGPTMILMNPGACHVPHILVMSRAITIKRLLLIYNWAQYRPDLCFCLFSSEYLNFRFILETFVDKVRSVAVFIFLTYTSILLLVTGPTQVDILVGICLILSLDSWGLRKTKIKLSNKKRRLK